jgi:ABC-type antimicrobial peptide transport system permease subunit
MTVRQLVFRSLAYHWRTNVAVILGVATAVAVLSGALLVGDSVRGSLRALVVERLGQTQQVVFSTGFVREQFGEDIQADSTFAPAKIAPMILTQGFVSVQSGEGRAGKVSVYGVDERFWSFHGVGVDTPTGRDALLSPALAAELRVQSGDTLLIRTQRPSDIPMESLHGRKDDAVRTVRAAVRSILPRESLGEFSLQAQQGAIRAVFLPLVLVQRELGVESRVNALLMSGLQDAGSLETLVRRHATLEDLGLRLRVLPGSIALESASGLLDSATADATLAVATESGAKPQRLFTYLANTLRIGSREVPYSVVTAIDSPGLAPSSARAPIALNDWASRDLNAKPGDMLSMEYFLWEEPGQLVTRTAEFRVDATVPISTGDSEMTPAYPGITNASTLRDWDPPFPVDLKRVRPVDEMYWDQYSTTPKAFIPFQTGQELWGSRYGALTSIRLLPPSNSTPAALLPEVTTRLRERIDPLHSGLVVQDVRSQSLDASRGATNFGEYFIYFSFFLVVSAILLSALFFKLNVEQRIRDVGLLRAVGISPATVRRVFLGEGLCLSLAGAVIGSVGGVFYAGAILWALRNWWIGAIGTETISLHVSPVSIVLGVIGGVVAALACIALTLRSLRRISERSLLAGELDTAGRAGRVGRSSVLIAVLAFMTALALLIAGAIGSLSRTAAFFGGGLLLLTAVLSYFHYRLSRPATTSIGPGAWPLARLGFRNASFRPVRSVVAVATIASATFILIAVDSFRKGAASEGLGGYAVLAETLVPIVHNPNTKDGQEALGLADLESVHFEAFRVRPGDDASCLNLYEPKNPRILAPPESFVSAARFSFRSSQASSTAEHANPWLLLDRKEPDGAIPVIADANSMTYVLHRNLGEDFVIKNRGQEVRLRFVAALADSIFQSELLMSQENFLKLFPEQQGYSFLLVESPREDTEALSAEIENALATYGADATPSATRLAEFHRVENTYLSTFQMLGGLGLLLGTIGLAAVLLRSIFERRRELALLRALGYEERHFFIMTLTENVLLLGGGLLAGTSCAILAIAPAAAAQGGRFPTIALAILLGVLFVVGIAVSLISTRAALREAVLHALRSE